MIQVAAYNDLRIDRFVDFGAYLDDGDKGILLPKRYVPIDAVEGDILRVFVYHDSDNKLIATTDKPHIIVNEIGYLKVVSTTPQGAFVDWGLMKDLFVPKSKQKDNLYPGEYYFVQAYIDEQTGRAAATQKIDALINNDNVVIKEKDSVHLRMYRETDLGYVCIVNHKYEGLLHYGDVFQQLYIGDVHQGYVKKIYSESNNIDVMLGKIGFNKVEDESGKIVRLLNEHNGYLPYHDKSEPEAIYAFFGMSKKVFKMTIGNLYKQQKIELTKTGIKLFNQ